MLVKDTNQKVSMILYLKLEPFGMYGFAADTSTMIDEMLLMNSDSK